MTMEQVMAQGILLPRVGLIGFAVVLAQIWNSTFALGNSMI
jgi:hypothetical protein